MTVTLHLSGIVAIYVHSYSHGSYNLGMNLFCSISYKTQIVGGVVHRIPITAGAVIEVSS